MFDLKAAVRPNIYSLKPYRCARDDYSQGILLDANENSHGPSLPNTNLGLERYPDPHQIELKNMICKLRHIPSPEHLFLGVGSDECIDMCLRVFCAPGREKILITPPTYGMYSVSAQINDVGVVKVPLLVKDGAFQLDTVNVLDAIRKDPEIKIVMLCSPGNPTGTMISKTDIKAVLEFDYYKGVVVVDEAYIDFCEDTAQGPASVATWVLNYPNLIVSQTLSKAFGLAAIRLGFTISSKEIASIFNATKAPYNISTPTSQLAITALGEGLLVMQKNISLIKAERSKLQNLILDLPFVSRLLGNHDANFILAQVIDKNGNPDNKLAHHIYKKLAESEKIVVRFRGNELGCLACLRITVGTAAENTQLIEKLKSILN